MMTGLDTNVLLRFLLNDDPIQSSQAKQAVDDVLRGEGAVFINRLVLSETVWVLGRGYRYGRDTILTVVESLLETDGFVVEDAGAGADAIRLCRAGGFDFPDALIGTTNAEDGCATTLTFDRKAAGLPHFAALPLHDRA